MRNLSSSWLWINAGLLILGMAMGASPVLAETTAPLFSVKIMDGNQPVAGAEALMLVEREDASSMRGSGKWKPVQAGAVLFSKDEVSTLTGRNAKPIERYHIIARAKGYAPAIVKVEAESTGEAATREVKVSMNKGREVTLELVPFGGGKLPKDLLPWIIPKEYVPPTWSTFYDKDSDPVNAAIAERQANGKYVFRIDDETPPLYVMINHPGFLRAWQPDVPVSTTGTVEQPFRLELPQTTEVNIQFANTYEAAMGAGDKPTLQIKTSHKMPGYSNWLVSAGTVVNEPGVREWKVSDLPSGHYYFAAKEGEVESRQSQGKEYLAGATAKVVLAAHSVIPPVVAVDENGTTIPEAEARIFASGGAMGTVESHGWTEAKGGLLKFARDSMTNRYAGDEAISNFEIEVRAPGYALASVLLKAGEPGANPVRVELNRGRKVTLQFKSEGYKLMPEGLKPVILSQEQFPRGLSYLSRPESAPALALAQPVGNDRYEFHLPEEIKEFRVGLDSAPFIRSFYTEPISISTDDVVEVILPRTGTLQVDVTLTSPPLLGKEAEEREKYFYQVIRTVGAGENLLNLHVLGETISMSTSSLIEGLPPGDYSVAVSRFPRNNTVSKAATVKPGATTSVKITAEPATGEVDEFGRQTPKLPSLKITGTDGRPVTDAQAIVRKKSSHSIQTLHWQKITPEGLIRPQMELRADAVDGIYEVLIRAEGYQVATLEVALPTTATVISVEMVSGKQVGLKLTTEDALVLPDDLSPAVFTEAWGLDVWLTTQSRKESIYTSETLLAPTKLKASGKGEYSLNIDAGSTAPLYVLVHHPGFLRAFQAGPFLPAEWATSKTVTVALPKPATLNAVFDQGADRVESPQVTMKISRSQKVPGANTWRLTIISEEVDASSATISARDLAPGEYTVGMTAATGQAVDMGTAYSTGESAELTPGDYRSLTLLHRPFKKEWLQGPFTALISVTDQKNEPAAGKPYKITWYESGHPQQTVAEGTVPENGVIKVENLAGIETPQTRDEIKQQGRGMPSFNVVVDSQGLGYISFFDYKDGKYHPPADGKKSKEYTFRVPPKEGDVAPDFAMIDLKTSDTIKLSDLKGKVILLEFWATWCGPCQGPMAENQGIMRKNRTAWKDKAEILTVSIDDDADIVRKHLDKNDWHQTLNTWAAPDPKDPEGSAWKSPAAKSYGITGVPTMLLIGSDGIIKKRGHIQEIEKDMDALVR